MSGTLVTKKESWFMSSTPGQEAVLVLGQGDENALPDEVLLQLGPFLLGTVHDVEIVRLAEPNLESTLKNFSFFVTDEEAKLVTTFVLGNEALSPTRWQYQSQV